MSRKQEQIKVCVRMRPLLPPYEDDVIWNVDEKENKVSASPGYQGAYGGFNETGGDASPYMKDKEMRRRQADGGQAQAFQFDNVFSTDVTSPQIYHTIVRPITKAFLHGYNGTIFLYGQTTSGKTYTMLGTPDIPGLLPCTIRDVFNGIKNDRENEYKVWVSYLEIYNEVVNDLLVPGSSNLKIKDDPSEGVVVAGLKRQQVWTFDQAIILMNFGEEHRVYKETSIHEHSSRSHTIFRIAIESNPRTQKGAKRCSMLNLVDLAGSERLNEFEPKTDTLGETGHINKSLFILSNVINKLAEGRSSHIPYRDSKLTRILSMALGGNSLTAIIATISPASMNYYQTLSTLRFATRAKTVKNKPQINEYTEDFELVKVYKEELRKMKQEMAVKVEEISIYQQQQLELQKHLINSKRTNERLHYEMQDMKQFFEQQQVAWENEHGRAQEEAYQNTERIVSELRNELKEKEQIILRFQDQQSQTRQPRC